MPAVMVTKRTITWGKVSEIQIQALNPELNPEAKK